MPALKEKAISLLGSVTGLGLATTVTGTIFTVPVGKVARISHVTVFNPTSSLAAATAVHFGSFMNNGAATSLASVTGANTNYLNIFATGFGAEASAGQTFQVFVASGANASASFNAWGFLADS